jgi:hemerythrin
MKKIEWSDEYLIGENEIDHQHKHLFEILNNLIEKRDTL